MTNFPMNTENPGLLTLSKDEARGLLYGDSDSYKLVSDTISDTTRWSVIHDIIIQRRSDGVMFEGGYSVGATECQDESPWEYDEPTFYEVVAEEYTATRYVRKYPAKKPVAPIAAPAAVSA